mmetsp:Transcript_38712/g.97503  ORF Transcript_38712/g.97503 Transcript_38712/m.97503 type:complete len:221 (+) Transcript_38712:1647-2309(+)
MLDAVCYRRIVHGAALAVWSRVCPVVWLPVCEDLAYSPDIHKEVVEGDRGVAERTWHFCGHRVSHGGGAHFGLDGARAAGGGGGGAGPRRPSENYTQCEGDDAIMPLYISVLQACNCAIILFGIVITFRVREIKYKLYNESAYILLSMYTILLFGVIIVILQASNSGSRIVLFVLRSLNIIAGTLITTCAVCLPKIVYMIQGEDQFSVTFSSHSGGTQST